MSENKTISMLQHEYNQKILLAMDTLHDARTDTDVDKGYKAVCWAAVKYRRELKKFLHNCYDICCKDESLIMKFMNDKFNLDPMKCDVSYELSNHTVKWTISLYGGKEKYHYISVLGRPIDMDSFYDWALNMFT